MKKRCFKVKTNNLTFSFSGLENKITAYFQEGHTVQDTAYYAVNSVCTAVERVTAEALKQYPGFDVVFSGGVASNSMLRSVLAAQNYVFAEPKLSTDNAMGIAVLTWMQENRP